MNYSCHVFDESNGNVIMSTSTASEEICHNLNTDAVEGVIDTDQSAVSSTNGRQNGQNRFQKTTPNDIVNDDCLVLEACAGVNVGNAVGARNTTSKDREQRDYGLNQSEAIRRSNEGEYQPPVREQIHFLSVRC